MVKFQFGQLEKSRMPKVGGWREIAAPSGEVPWDLIHEWGRLIGVVMIWRLYRYVVEKRAENDREAVNLLVDLRSYSHL